MKSSDFRIGNYYHFYDTTGLVLEKVDLLEPQMVDVNPLFFIKPILITEAWLMKLGFMKEELKTRTYWHNYDIKLIKGYKRDGYPFHLVCNILSVKPIRYVHELQNLHFALTGIELTLKENGQKET
jgi:hypothetical protein